VQNGAVGAWIALSLVPDLGPKAFCRLLGRFGTPDDVFAAATSDLKEVVPAPIAECISDGYQERLLAPALAWLDETGHAVITLADERYPARLLEIADPPPLIYVDGEPATLNLPALAIVGSRNASPQGLKTAQNFAHALSDAGLTIVSGLALGIDAAAHRGGVAGRSGSIAVFGTGITTLYPARNRELAAEIAKSGALVSEFPIGYPILAQNFPRRNRLISGLSLGCLVVEAALHSGSLITAQYALEQGREVFAVPGSIHSPMSKGPHRLLKQGAKLVECVDDVLLELNLPVEKVEDKRPAVASNPQTQALLEAMGYEACAVDTICERSAFAASEVCSLLLTLELEGKVASLPGGYYQRVV
jgi:DNA processing protein